MLMLTLEMTLDFFGDYSYIELYASGHMAIFFEKGVTNCVLVKMKESMKTMNLDPTFCV